MQKPPNPRITKCQGSKQIGQQVQIAEEFGTMAHDLHSRKVPYLISPRKRQQEYTTDEKNTEEEWLKKREERRKTYLPSGWWNYFMDCLQVKIRDGDSLGLWISSSATEEFNGGESGGEESKPGLPFVLMLHGGGYSGLTWAPLVDELSRLIFAEFGALDLRGHGESECRDEQDLCLETLTQDVLDAIHWMQENSTINLNKRPLILVGHSMGGALGVNVALKLQESDQFNLAGLVVLDVVEGSAMLALNTMQFFLRSRPQEFKSLPEAIQWCTRSGQTKNLDSARISIAGQLKLKSTGQLATQSVSRTMSSDESCDIPVTSRRRMWVKEGDNHRIPEENDLSSSCPPPSDTPLPNSEDKFVWRIELSNTETFWRGWFEGLSKKFLSTKCPKLLMLAGVDRLDKELTVGQMQGKFQMQVFHQVGHAVHEDVPEKAAECVASFLCRQKIAKAKGHLPAALPGC